MIPLEELRPGNHIFWNPKFVRESNEQLPYEITEISKDKVGFIPVHLEHRVEFFDDGIKPPETHFESPDEIAPVPITGEWLEAFAENLNYPVWIKYVHELQNWYFWNHHKTELAV